jgi:hypothetical protein
MNKLDQITVQDAILIFTGVTAALSAFWIFMRFIYPLMRTMTRIRDAFLGKPAHNGFAAQPGIPERLGKVEERLEVIERHVVPNHGSTALLSENLQKVMDQQQEILERLGNGPADTDTESDHIEE